MVHREKALGRLWAVAGGGVCQQRPGDGRVWDALHGSSDTFWGLCEGEVMVALEAKLRAGALSWEQRGCCF